MNTLPWLSSSSKAAKLKRRASNLREECPHPALQFVPRLFDILVWQRLGIVSIIKKWLRKRIYFIFSFHTDKKRVRRINMKWKRPRKKVARFVWQKQEKINKTRIRQRKGFTCIFSFHTDMQLDGTSNRMIKLVWFQFQTNLIIKFWFEIRFNSIWMHGYIL